MSFGRGPGSTQIEYAWRRQLYSAIGTRIREVREENQMSAKQVAERLGCAYSTLVNVEAGALPCPVYVLVQLAHLFDVTLDDFVPIDCEVKLRDGVSPPTHARKENAHG